ncbi:outer membrane protein assembly factor BamE domain-containing protein [Endozoicomonas acroporae]|uniref:outer membrane protein assembly factor BamE domain-containing protein n=1 Tax=Endozoicomonas acroporae TaxID=1701104 RepID=UPI003D7BFE7F
MFLTACVTGDNVSNIEPGMSQDHVVKIMGKPDGFKQSGEYTIYTYTNRLISGWSWDRTDYSFIFKNNQLVEYGAGEIRERNVGGMQTIFLYNM